MSANLDAVDQWEPAATALLLVGFQNDFFSARGALRPSIADPSALDRTLQATMRLVSCLAATDVTMVASPICFSERYTELTSAVGILATIRDLEALRSGSPGSATLEEMGRFGDRIREVEGRHGFDAFFGTDLTDVLLDAGVQRVLLAGALTSVCIDSSARAARERGFQVGIIEDCTVGRTAFEHRFYCEQIFPLYADVVHSRELLRLAGPDEGEAS
ncbi:MAG TPA: cysteine hydrolase family protein [Acidimicrobiales bacterium]|nr:cysteine hydrolase family protein [Acidimicrobiales bacterium]